jgi:hypothetical protein
MDLNGILAELKAEHQRLGRIIKSIEELRGRTAPARPKRRGRKYMDAAARKAVSERMKSYWEAKRAQAPKKSEPEAQPEGAEPQP